MTGLSAVRTVNILINVEICEVTGMLVYAMLGHVLHSPKIILNPHSFFVINNLNYIYRVFLSVCHGHMNDVKLDVNVRNVFSQYAYWFFVFPKTIFDFLIIKRYKMIRTVHELYKRVDCYPKEPSA